MSGYDFGVGLAFWLSLIGTALCIFYGIWRWNKDDNGSVSAKDQQNWSQEEYAISEEL